MTASMLLGPAMGSAFAASVTPTPNEGNVKDCPSGYATLVMTPPDDSDSDEGVTVDVTYNEDDTIDFEATGGLVYIAYVKGGDAYNEYDYRPGGVASDTDLVSPLNNGGQVPAVSHVVFCVKPTTTTTTSTSSTSSTTTTTTSSSSTSSTTTTTTSTTTTSTTGTESSISTSTTSTETSGTELPATGTPNPTLPSTSTEDGSGGGPSGGSLALVIILLAVGASGLVILNPASIRIRK